METPELLGIILVSIIGGCLLKFIIDILWGMHIENMDYRIERIAAEEVEREIRWHLEMEHGDDD